MRLPGREDLGQLTYCTNIHAGADWSDMIAGLRRWVPSIKAQVCADDSFGLGLRISASAAADLKAGRLSELQSFLADHGCHVFTINGFPYGPFHGQPVKSQVYAPDWQSPERLAYTNTLTDILAGIVPNGMDGSISTVPGSFKPWSVGKEAVIAEGLIAAVAHLVRVQRETGRTIRLALEPEPCCMLETIAETVAYFERHLFAREAVARLSTLTGLPAGEAEVSLRELIGVCYDVCHAAVEYEIPEQSIADLAAAGIDILKVQLSSALRIERLTPALRDALIPFDEPVYLHQVIARDPTDPSRKLTRYTDLPDALAEIDHLMGQEWRIHFHVPVFIETLKDFGTTQAFLRAILDLHRRQPISPHLEIETYTWDVLPDHYRAVDVDAAVVREIEWVRSELLR